MISIFLELGAGHMILACTKEAKPNQVFRANWALPQAFFGALFRIFTSYSFFPQQRSVSSSASRRGPKQRWQCSYLPFFLFIYFIIYFWLHRVSVAAHKLFVAARGLLSSCGFWAPEHVGSVVATWGLSSCGTQA